MLPHVNTKNRDFTCTNDWILILRGHDTETSILVLVLDEPAPSAPLDTQKGCVELLLERVEITECLRDGGGQFRSGGRVRLSGAWWSKVSPKETVIDVSYVVCQ